MENVELQISVIQFVLLHMNLDINVDMINNVNQKLVKEIGMELKKENVSKDFFIFLNISFYFILNI